MGHGQFLFRLSPPARRFLLQEGTDLKYGARHLKRAIEKFVVHPLANLLATEQIHFGDMLVLEKDTDEERLSFHREGQGAVISLPSRRAVRAPAARVAVRASGEDKEKSPTRELEPAIS